MGRASTCAISGLPIEEGDLALFFPLAQWRPYSESMPASWMPISPGMAGTYDEDLQTVRLNDSEGSPAAGLIARALGFENGAQMARAAINGSIEEPEREGATSKRWLGVSWALVRRDAWEALLSMPMAGSVFDRQGGGASFAVLAQEACVQARAWAGEVLEEKGRRREMFEEFKAHAKDPADIETMERLCLSRPVSCSGLADTSSFDLIFGRDARPDMSVISPTMLAHGVEPLAWRAMPELASQEGRGLEDAVMDMARLAAAQGLMFCLRKMWAPSAPTGPQAGYWAAHWMFADKLRELAGPRVAESQEPPLFARPAKALMEAADLAATTKSKPRGGPGV